MKKHLLIINTGGTIGMRPTDAGLAPDVTSLDRELAEITRQWSDEVPDYEIRNYDPLLDSANFCPADWLRIARDIVTYYDDFDAFLVLHGTDTMAYTASALAFMLRGLDKNIILTGSQLPLGRRRNDARENLITAMIIATEYRVPEVCVLFGSVLLRGCRATKISVSSFDAFDSPNTPPLATIGTHIRVYENRAHIAAAREEPVSVLPIRNAAVATLRLFPGIDAKVLENVLRTPLQGLILESYGAGNGPSSNRDFLDTLKRATDRGVVIVNLSQCRQGSVTQEAYATGRALSAAGLVPGHDMTIEAALTKLMFLFSRDLAVEEVRQRVSQNLVGELTPP
jgi:L-asparaginase